MQVRRGIGGAWLGAVILRYRAEHDLFILRQEDGIQRNTALRLDVDDLMMWRIAEPGEHSAPEVEVEVAD